MILIIEAKIVLLGYYLGIRSEEYKTMKIAIMATGGVGGVFGAKDFV